MTTTATAAELSSRPVPPMGGFSFTVLKLEIRRLLRNRRTVIFALVTPSIFFLLFGLNAAYANESAGKGNVSAFILISMALYGCGPGDHERRGDDLHRAGAGLDQAAAG